MNFVGLLKERRAMYYCDECGKQYVLGTTGVSTHLDAAGNRDYDADEDHAAYGEELVISEPNAQGEVRPHEQPER